MPHNYHIWHPADFDDPKAALPTSLKEADQFFEQHQGDQTPKLTERLTEFLVELQRVADTTEDIEREVRESFYSVIYPYLEWPQKTQTVHQILSFEAPLYAQGQADFFLYRLVQKLGVVFYDPRGMVFAGEHVYPKKMATNFFKRYKAWEKLLKSYEEVAPDKVLPPRCEVIDRVSLPIAHDLVTSFGFKLVQSDLDPNLPERLQARKGEKNYELIKGEIKFIGAFSSGVNARHDKYQFSCLISIVSEASCMAYRVLCDEPDRLERFCKLCWFSFDVVLRTREQTFSDLKPALEAAFAEKIPEILSFDSYQRIWAYWQEKQAQYYDEAGVYQGKAYGIPEAIIAARLAGEKIDFSQHIRDEPTMEPEQKQRLIEQVIPMLDKIAAERS